jgi:hypothetical protein
VLLGSGDGSFATYTSYPAGLSPWSVAIGDFNDDGQQDLAVANTTWVGTVSVLLGNGDGSFATYTSYLAGVRPGSVAIGDFNGDGQQDLAVENYSWEGKVSVLLGNGDGSFATYTSYPAGTYPLSIAVGDFDGNGWQDLVVANRYYNEVSVLLGNGDGSFATEISYQVGYYPWAVAIGDFNGDGRQDLAVANFDSDDVSVLFGNGDGSFATQTRYPAGLHPQSVAIGDFNGGGRQDLAVTTSNWGGAVSVLLNQLPMIIEIDIMPNSINPRSLGVVPVALLGSADFDVADVDVTTLRFGPDEASPAHDLTDTWTYTEHLQDVNLDGFTDLMTHFWMQDTGIACGFASATLTGSLLSGQDFEGTDSFRTVGCRTKFPVSHRLDKRQRPASFTTDQPVDVSFEKKD